jgi:hypothetical protein
MFRVPSTTTKVVCRVAVYASAIDEKLGFFVAKIWVILVEREILDRLK